MEIATQDGTKLKVSYLTHENGGPEKLAIFASDLGHNRGGFIGKLSKDPMMTVDNDHNILYRNLLEGGWNVLTYDYRGHGDSDAPATGTVGNSYHEWKDAVAV
jgi:uncharacterized protein